MSPGHWLRLSPCGHGLSSQARREESGAWPASLPPALYPRLRSAPDPPLSDSQAPSPGASVHHEGPQGAGYVSPAQPIHLPSEGDIGCPKPKQTLRDVVPGARGQRGQCWQRLFPFSDRPVRAPTAILDELLLCSYPRPAPSCRCVPDSVPGAMQRRDTPWPPPSKARPGARSRTWPRPRRGKRRRTFQRWQRGEPSRART